MAHAEVRRQCGADPAGGKSTPTAYDRVSKDDAHLGFFSFLSSFLSRGALHFGIERSSNGSSRSRRALEATTLPSCFDPFRYPPSSRHSGP